MRRALLILLITAPLSSYAQDATMCEEACWACSASDSELKSKYGSAEIPREFRFAQRYDVMTNQKYRSCMAPHGASGVFNRSISGRCTEEANALCERRCRSDYGGKVETTSTITGSSNKSGRTWHCLCYQERVRGVATQSTACRKTAKECWQLHGKIDYGTQLLVEDSQGESCYQVQGDHPHNGTRSSKSQWRRSKKSGSWWSPQGCLLNDSLTVSPGESIEYSPPESERYQPPRSTRSYGRSTYSYDSSTSSGGSCSSLSSCKMACSESHCSVVAECINNCMSFSGESLYDCVSNSFQTICSR